MIPNPDILLSRVECTVTIPVDLSSQLDLGEPALTETRIELVIETPQHPMTLPNALAVTLDAALRTAWQDPERATVTAGPPPEGLQQIQVDPDGNARAAGRRIRGGDRG